MKKLTLITTYFNQEEWLESLIAYWNQYYKKFVNDIDIIIVDDYSSAPAFPIVKKKYLYDNISVIRVTKDLKFNVGGARNVGVHESKTDNVLLVDLDTLVCSDLITEIFSWKYTENTFYYRFFNEVAKIDMNTNSRYQKSSNSLYVKKDIYVTVGGYPKQLNGYYGYEDHIMYDYLEIYFTKKFTSRTGSGHEHIDLTACPTCNRVNDISKITNLKVKSSSIPIFSIGSKEHTSRGCKIINTVPLYRNSKGASSDVNRNNNRNQKLYYQLLKEKLMKPVFKNEEVFLCDYELEC